MQRDMDLVRRILLAIEADETDGHQGIDLKVDDAPRETVAFHLILMAEAGLIRGYETSDKAGRGFTATRMTWEGYEFLDAARSETAWTSAKAKVAGKAGGLAFEVLKALLIDQARRAIGLG